MESKKTIVKSVGAAIFALTMSEKINARRVEARAIACMAGCVGGVGTVKDVKYALMTGSKMSVFSAMAQVCVSMAEERLNAKIARAIKFVSMAELSIFAKNAKAVKYVSMAK